MHPLQTSVAQTGVLAPVKAGIQQTEIRSKNTYLVFFGAYSCRTVIRLTVSDFDNSTAYCVTYINIILMISALFYSVAFSYCFSTGLSAQTALDMSVVKRKSTKTEPSSNGYPIHDFS
ncbi:hypothetical protein C5749_07740 [Sphingobacterium gobiense]|uniref:Uncharacterized protein n=1 Tax=Sphingobacterium gobiense TaxID=1382456 RepID=A0A2S9JUX4_9SPHI|nr:hypothetical protein C5749_07740 [Sphingobacterium gobiense]